MWNTFSIISTTPWEPAMLQTNEDEEGQEIKETRSSSQLSFINQAAHFRGLLKHIDGFEDYAPNEEDLQLPALYAVLMNSTGTTKKQPFRKGTRESHYRQKFRHVRQRHRPFTKRPNASNVT